MESTEEFSVCLNNEALSRVRVYLYKPFHSRERENAKGSLTVWALYAYFSDSQNAAFELLVWCM